MIRILLQFFSIIILNSCDLQKNGSSNYHHIDTLLVLVPDGSIYFSGDNGRSLVNSSKGLPEKTRIALDGIAVSNRDIGVATKDDGIYIYNFKTTIWENVPVGKHIINANIGPFAIFDNALFIGTQFQGVFRSTDNGKTWKSINNGLTSFAIRRFSEFNNVLYACTNNGFYAFNETAVGWNLLFRQNFLQTNGATLFKGRFYLATNAGVFSQLPDKSWTNSSPQFSVHNISSDKNQLYAMTYNELLMSSEDGKTWQSQQNGLPKHLYTFNVVNHDNTLFAGQWDGIYRKTSDDLAWRLSSTGLPAKFAVTNLKKFNNLLVISTSER